MTSTIARIEEDLNLAGYKYNVPLNDKLFAVGDGDLIDDAPLGYYRFHFWKSDDICKEHENYLAISDTLGPICISFIKCASEDTPYQTFYRFLIRSNFGYTSLVIQEDTMLDYVYKGKKLSDEVILSVALDQFFDHERMKLTGLLANDETVSICSVAPTEMSTRSERIRFLPVSRLKGVEDENGICKDLSIQPIASKPSLLRRASMSIGTKLSLASVTESLAKVDLGVSDVENSLSTKKKLSLLSSANPSQIKELFQSVRDKDLSRVLLSMEQSLLIKTLHFDIVLVRERSLTNPEAWEKNWSAFSKVLGREIRSSNNLAYTNSLLQKQGRVPSQVIESLLGERREKMAELPKPKANSKSDDLARFKWNAEEEMLSKERNYIEVLQLIIQNFLRPIKTSPSKLLDVSSISKIFGGIEELLDIHQKFYSELVNVRPALNLKAYIKYAKETKIFYTAYIDYCRDYSMRIVTLTQKLETSKEFREFHDTAILAPGMHKQTLAQLLIYPVQHIQRYCTHLSEIARYTSVHDPYRLELLAAFETINEVAIVVDKATRESDGTRQMFEIQSKIENFPVTLISPSRLFQMKMAVYENDGSKTRYTLFLFNDILLGAQKITTNFRSLDTSSRKSKKRANSFRYLYNFHRRINKLILRKAKITTSGGSRDALVIEFLPIEPDENFANTKMIRYFFPKNESKLEKFHMGFKEAQHTKNFSESPSVNYYFQGDDFDAYFHVFELEDWSNWTSKSPTVLFYSDHSGYPNLAGISANACGVIQAKNGAFRFSLKMRDLLFASSAVYSPTNEFVAAEKLSPAFIRAISNSQRLMFMYPPFSATIEHQLRYDLETKVKPFGKTVVNRLKSFASSTLLRLSKSKTHSKNEADHTNTTNGNPEHSTISRRTSHVAQNSFISSPLKGYIV